MGFRSKFENAEKALTFNDVLLLPGWTTLEPNEADDIPGPVSIAVVAENTETGARLVVFGDSEFVVDLAFFVQRNGDMFINSVDWATEQEELINLTPNVGTQRLLLPPFPLYTNLVILFSVCLVPGAVFVAGVVVWVLRRRRM